MVGKTGWPPGLLQDDSRGLSRWFASRIDARLRLREAMSGEAERELLATVSAVVVELQQRLDAALLEIERLKEIEFMYESVCK